MGRIITRQELSKIIAELKKAGKKIVTTNGTFDILHAGHAYALKTAKSHGDVLIVGLNSDSSVKKYKGDKRPIIGQNERAALLAELSCVDYVTIFDEPDPREFLEVARPNVHVKSGDWAPEKIVETAVVQKHGGEVKIIPFVGTFSTTSIIKKITEAYCNNS